MRSLRRQLIVLGVQVDDACEVRGITYVHSVGQRLYRSLGLVLACLQVFIEDVVGVVGSNEALDGQSHSVAEQCRADVAEIAAGHTHHEIVGFSQSLDSCVGVEVVERLRKEAGHVDGVGRRELHVLIQFLIHKGRLYQCLAVVEHTVYLDSRDVLAQCGELALLNGTDLALRIEHINVDAVNAEEAVGYGRTRVATGSHEYVHRFVCCDVIATYRTVTQEVLQQTGHKAGTDVLEGEGGAVEELQRIDAL